MWSPSTSKNSSTSAAILAHREGVEAASRASLRASFGSLPPAFHAAISSSKYAPCCSAVRWRVSRR